MEELHGTEQDHEEPAHEPGLAGHTDASAEHAGNQPPASSAPSNSHVAAQQASGPVSTTLDMVPPLAAGPPPLTPADGEPTLPRAGAHRARTSTTRATEVREASRVAEERKKMIALETEGDLGHVQVIALVSSFAIAASR